MKIYIKFNRVLDHLDILSEESAKYSQLIDSLRAASKEIQSEDMDQEVYINQIINQVENLQRNVSRRRNLLLEIISILKDAGIKTNVTISEAEFKIDKLSEGE